MQRLANCAPGERLLIPEFITEDEQGALCDWAVRMRPHLSNNGPGRAYNNVERLPEKPTLYDAVRLRLEASLALPAEAEQEPVFGWYLSAISEGGAVHSHMDPTPPNRRHLRCNLFLQLPERGGLPFIERQIIPVRERMVLAFFPSEERHASEPVVGGRWRMICSFGYLVPLDYRLPADVQTKGDGKLGGRDLALTESARL